MGSLGSLCCEANVLELGLTMSQFARSRSQIFEAGKLRLHKT